MYKSLFKSQFIFCHVYKFVIMYIAVFCNAAASFADWRGFLTVPVSTYHSW